MATALFFIWSRAPQKWHQNGKIKCVLIANLVFPKHATVCISQQADGRARRKKSEKNIGCTQGGIRRELLKALLSVSKRDFAKRRRCWPPFSTLLDKNQNERVHLYMKYPRERIQRKCSLLVCYYDVDAGDQERPTSDRGSDK
jgi:hypothetical protein